eukprot:gene13584-13709_t
MHLNVESDEAGADASIPDPERDQCAYTPAADAYDSYSNGCTAARLTHSELPVPTAVSFPSELSAVRPQVEAYTQARICSFAHVFARAFAQQAQVKLTPDGISSLTSAILSTMYTTAAAPAAAEPGQQEQQRRLQLVLRHTCLSSGCGETCCDLCRYNPSRLCRNNLKSKYLIDDHLKAKCGGALHVVVADELDEQQQAVTDALTDAVLEVHILNGDKYKELAPNGDAQGLLSQQQLRTCIVTPIANSNKPLLKRETGFTSVPWDMRMLLPLECTTSSEALLQGKAPTFRLLVWAVDRISGMPLPAVGYAVSESFVVATKRVKHALKNDIPCIDDDISKLLHVGRATIDKLKDIKKAAAEEGKELHVPDALNQIAKVGQFRELVDMTELSNELKQKLRQLLKFSPEKWEELAQHALSAVVPDYRPRVWWCTDIKGGLVFPCRGGAAQVEQQPLAFVYREAPGKTETVMPLQQEDEEGYARLGLGGGGVLEHAQLAAAAGVSNDTVNFADWEVHSRGIASRLLARMGFKRGGGLGRTGAGISVPLEISILPSKKGLGAVDQDKLQRAPGTSGNGSSSKHKHRSKNRNRGGERTRRRKAAAARHAVKAADGSRQQQLEAATGSEGVFAFINYNLGQLLCLVHFCCYSLRKDGSSMGSH